MLYDKKKEVMKKYEDTLRKVRTANPLPRTVVEHFGDLGVAFDMMREMARKGDHAIYKGVPEDFDWEQFKRDIQELKA